MYHILDNIFLYYAITFGYGFPRYLFTFLTSKCGDLTDNVSFQNTSFQVFTEIVDQLTVFCVTALYGRCLFSTASIFRETEYGSGGCRSGWEEGIV